MSTNSTKSRAAKRESKNEANFIPIAGEGERLTASEVSALPEHIWLVASIAVLLLAAILRLFDLDLVPLHHDEGVNGFFLTRLYRDGFYQYDPQNYHGPTLYYFALVSVALFGLKTFAIRLVPALFGVATVWLILGLRRRLGAIGALSAAALIAVSPGAVYLSRYFIHESLFVFFTLGIVVSGLRYYDKAQPVYLLLASASAALLFATKETAMISAAVLFIALASTIAYFEMVKGRDCIEAPKKGKNRAPRRNESRTAQLMARFGGSSNLVLFSLVAVTLFLIINLLFYSSFFTNYPKGIHDALQTFKFWTRTGKNEHVHPWYTYLQWLWQEESPLLLIGYFGACLAFVKARNRFAVFAGLWALGVVAAYSLIPYKTPWLAFNFIVPLAIAAGYTFDVVYTWDADLAQRLPGILFLAVAIIFSGYQMVSLNFFHYDDDAYAYVYAHTQRPILDLVKKIDDIASRAGTGKQGTGITIVSPDYWPLPWYLRDYKQAGFYGQPIASYSTPIVIAKDIQIPELQAALAGRYVEAGSYVLRPGVTLVLYVRREAAKT